MKTCGIPSSSSLYLIIGGSPFVMESGFEFEFEFEVALQMFTSCWNLRASWWQSELESFQFQVPPLILVQLSVNLTVIFIFTTWLSP